MVGAGGTSKVRGKWFMSWVGEVLRWDGGFSRLDGAFLGWC